MRASTNEEVSSPSATSFIVSSNGLRAPFADQAMARLRRSEPPTQLVALSRLVRRVSGSACFASNHIATHPGRNSVWSGMCNPAGVQRDCEALEKRRFAAVRLLDKRLNRTEVARRVKARPSDLRVWRCCHYFTIKVNGTSGRLDLETNLTSIDENVDRNGGARELLR